MKFVEQQDASMFINWGTIKEGADPARNIVVKKGSCIQGKILKIKQWEKKKAEDQQTFLIRISLYDDEDRPMDTIASFFTPKMLTEWLGLGEKHMQHPVVEGDFVKIQYDGKEKGAKKPHQFKVFIAEQ